MTRDRAGGRMVRPPEVLASHHRTAGFSSGAVSFDDWLQRRALQSLSSGTTRTYVVGTGDGELIGYYALASGAIDIAVTSERQRRNMPDPIPVVILTRLAIAQSHRGRGLGRALFADAARRVLHAADAIGIRGIITHAVSPEAAAFCLALGFDPSPLDPMVLYATLNDLRAA